MKTQIDTVKYQSFSSPQGIFAKHHQQPHLKKDVVGIGIGPFNLSLAALLEPVRSISCAFFEKRQQFTWHEGLLFENAELQVHYLKDLVSLVDPTSKFTFLNFLADKKRLYHFINANFPRVSRKEFNQYFCWVSQQLGNLHFGYNAKEIELKKDQLLVTLERDNKIVKIETPTVVMGIGLQPFIPEFALKHLGKQIYHASNFLINDISLKGKKVVVVGGGQTGAEIVKHLLNNQANPRELVWLSRRDNFLPIDESPFVNDLFTPSHINHFYHQSDESKRRLLIKQRLFSDGISPRTLEEIYRELYRLKFLTKDVLMCSLMPRVDVKGLHQQDGRWKLDIMNCETRESFDLDTDIVIFCTGYRYQVPDFLLPLQDRFYKDDFGNYSINSNYSLQWDGPQNCKFYIQNGAAHSHGIADPNLSLMAWRSATIINSISKRSVYEAGNQGSFIDWNTTISGKKDSQNRVSDDVKNVECNNAHCEVHYENKQCGNS